MSEILFLVESSPEGGYSAKAFGVDIFTDADDLAGLHANVRDTVRCHFDDGDARRSAVVAPALTRGRKLKPRDWCGIVGDVSATGTNQKNFTA